MTKFYQRKELPDLFEQAGLPRMTLSTLHKLHALGDGPPVDLYVGRAAIYNGDQCIAWRRARLAAQTASACERQEWNLKYRMEQLERLQRQAKAARESAAA